MSERAVRLWAKIKGSLDDRGLYRDGEADPRDIKDSDAEQIAAIDAVLGDRSEDGLAQVDKVEIKVHTDRTPEGVPMLIAMSTSFIPKYGDSKIHVKQGKALVIEPRNGSVNIHRRNVSW